MRRFRFFALLTSIIASGCGGQVASQESGVAEGTPTPTGDGQASGGSGSQIGRPPMSPPPPGPSAPAPTSPPPAVVGAPPAGPSTFHLAVQNRSTRAGVMGVELTLDGTKVVAGGFAPLTPYDFPFAIAPGPHRLVVDVDWTVRSIPTHEVRDFTLPSGDEPTWGALDLTTFGCDPCGGALVDFALLDHPPTAK